MRSDAHVAQSCSLRPSEPGRTQIRTLRPKKVHKLEHLKLHGKLLLADDVAAIVGSINFATGSLDGRRELAIRSARRQRRASAAQGVAARLGHSHPLDLPLLADLEGRIAGAEELLAIDV